MGSRGSGEWLEREEYLQLIAMVESEQYDLVITEDLGRIVRRIHAPCSASCASTTACG